VKAVYTESTHQKQCGRGVEYVWKQCTLPGQCTLPYGVGLNGLKSEKVRKQEPRFYKACFLVNMNVKIYYKGY